MKGKTGIVIGFVVGVASVCALCCGLFVLVGLFGGSEPSGTPVPAVDVLGTPLPTATATPGSWAPPFEKMCDRPKSMTDVQFVEYLESLRGKKVIDWTGWVYDVRARGGEYQVQIAMKPPGSLFWTRQIELTGIPKDQALRLAKEQKITFSGTIRDIDAVFGAVCNPIAIDDGTVRLAQE